MDPIDLLEKRVAALELQILPPLGSDYDLAANKTQITDLLIQTHAMISTALSCREIITSILQKMPTINDYLDPTYSENDLEIEAKRQYVMELYPELKETADLIHEFEKIKPVIDSKSIMKINELVDKLDVLTVSNLSIYEESVAVTRNVLNSLQQYNDITLSIRRLFSQLEQSVTDIEIMLQPKVAMEE